MHRLLLALLLATAAFCACCSTGSAIVIPDSFPAAKFGLFIHFAPVVEWGAELSWPLVCTKLPCEVQSANPSTITIRTIDELKRHRRAYASLPAAFNPRSFDADALAELAAAAGFRYVVFTTVHCDGFANYRTQTTNYSIEHTPFGRDMFALIASAFRKRGIRVGAYYCPSLWQAAALASLFSLNAFVHSGYRNNDLYWYPDATTALAIGCRPSYDPLRFPQRWDSFVSFVHKQVTELIDQYRPDLFWFGQRTSWKCKAF